MLKAPSGVDLSYYVVSEKSSCNSYDDRSYRFVDRDVIFFSVGPR
jgi:hypothetical protein